VARRFGRARALALDITPLRESVPYRALWLGQLLSQIGTQMRFVAVPFQVFRITGSTVAVGLLGLVEVVPLIVFSIVGGALADSTDRKRLTAWVQIGLMASSAALAAISFVVAEPALWAIFVLTGLSSAFSAIERPARTAMAPSLVAPEQLPAIMALRQVVLTTTQIVGPAVGGVLIAVLAGRGTAHDGVGWVYVIDTVTFVAALISLRWVPSMPPDRSAAELRSLRGQTAAVTEGFRFSVRNGVILPVFVVDLVAMIFGMPRAVFPALAERSFGGAGALGLLYAAPAAGALVGALTSGWVMHVRRHGLAVLVAVALWGLSITLVGLSLFSFALTLLLLAFAGAADVVSAVFRGTILLENTPEPLRGRVSALQLMVVTSGPRLGDVEAGLLAGAVGAPASIVVGGLASLAGTGWVAARWAQFRRYETTVRQDGASPRLEDEPEL
jgi:MFS family permease